MEAELTPASGPLTDEVGAKPNLVISGLSKSFGRVPVLSGVSLSVGYGEVHGLLGQNGSGKSTLIKLLSGVYEPDGQPEVTLDGQAIPLPIAPNAFNRYGMGIVHQALGLVPSLSVTENFFINTLVRNPNWFINWGQAGREAKAIFDGYGLVIDPGARVDRLAPVERALVAIARAFHEIREATAVGRGLLILDEPTPFLSGNDVEKLFALVRSVAAQGTSVLFVSHDIDEVKSLTDRATVLRNGRVSASLVTRNSTHGDFVRAIVGSDVRPLVPAVPLRDAPLKVKVTGLRTGTLSPFNMEVRQGEIIGLTGLVGSGYDQIPYLLFGARRAEEGLIEINGTRIPAPKLTPRLALSSGAVLIPADRQKEGVVPSFSVADNIGFPMIGPRISRWLVTAQAVQRVVAPLVSDYDVRPRNASLPTSALSGGNQQKVVLAKWLQTKPKLILLDEPTQGVDVGARQQVFSIIAQAAASGASVICASSDHEQLSEICSRVLIFSRGRVIDSLEGAQVNKDAITERCFGSERGTLTVTAQEEE